MSAPLQFGDWPTQEKIALLCMLLGANDTERAPLFAAAGVTPDDTKLWEKLFIEGGAQALDAVTASYISPERLNRLEKKLEGASWWAMANTIAVPIVGAVVGALIWLHQNSIEEHFTMRMAELNAGYAQTAMLYERRIDAYLKGHQHLRQFHTVMAEIAVQRGSASVEPIHECSSKLTQWLAEESFFLSETGADLVKELYMIGMELTQLLEAPVGPDADPQQRKAAIKAALARFTQIEEKLEARLREDLWYPMKQAKGGEKS